jgi:cytochrome P450 family 4
VLNVGLFNFFTLNVTRPKDVETVLLSKGTQNKAQYYDFFRPWLGNGLLTSNGKEWASQRKIITPAFHFNILNEFLVVFNRRIDQMMGILAKYDGGVKSCDIHEYIALCAMDIICGELDESGFEI